MNTPTHPGQVREASQGTGWFGGLQERRSSMKPLFSGRSCTLVLILTGCLAAGVAAQAAEVSCLECHDDQKQQFTSSAHAQAGLSCRDCHGGNPSAADMTAHETKDFKKPANKREIAESCAKCHSDVRRMNPYGLPTDQLERYKTSKHGEQLYGQGDQKVATCTDCHGVHNILKVRAPQSPTHPTQIPQTCGKCHSDANLMSQYKLPADVVAQYQQSYHAYLLLQKGDLSAPTCITCHGNHGAVPPGTEQVGQVCGKCHVRQRELFEQSPHAKQGLAGNFKQCVSCHSNHAIRKASLALLDESCARCHAQQPKALAVRDSILTLLRNAQDHYQQATQRVQAATVHGLATEDEQMLLQEAATYVTQLEVSQHALAPEQLQSTAARAETLVKEALKGIAWLERTEHLKRLILSGFWVFLALMAVLFWLKRRALELPQPQERTQP